MYGARTKQAACRNKLDPRQRSSQKSNLTPSVVFVSSVPVNGVEVLDMMDDEFLWPRSGLHPFVAVGSNCCNAWLPTEPDWLAYFEGYRRGLHVLVNDVVYGGGNQDYLVYPVMFLARQTFEVGLKYVLLLARELNGASDQPFPGTHDLRVLWGLVRPLLEGVKASPTRADLDAVEEAIFTLADHDPTSFAFRYPVDRGNRHPSFTAVDHRSHRPELGEMPNLFNLHEFDEWVERCANFLRAGMDCLRAEIIGQAEALTAFRDLHGVPDDWP